MAKKDYKILVLSYLLQHPEEPVKREKLIEDTGISKSRLSEILKAIRSDGYTIESPPRSGIIILKRQKDQVILPKVSDCDLRKWIILFLLRKYKKLTYLELIRKILGIKYYDPDLPLKLDDKKVYDDNSIIKALSTEFSGEEGHSVAKEILSIPTLRKDLNTLREAELVTRSTGSKTIYQLTDAAPIILSVSEENLLAFCLIYEEQITATTELLPVKKAYHKIQRLIAWDGLEQEQRRFGKVNQISREQMDHFNQFISHPYQKNQITIEDTYRSKRRRITISVGLLYYSVETGSFYALCYNHTNARTEAIRLDYMENITDENQTNRIFHSKKYEQIYEEMFGTGYEEDVYHVKVLVQDFGNVISRFRTLTDLRKNATLRRIQNKPEDCDYDYVYEDEVRGLMDFARTLRSFGYSAMAVEPPELREQMKRTYSRILEKYKKMEEENHGK